MTGDRKTTAGTGGRRGRSRGRAADMQGGRAPGGVPGGHDRGGERAPLVAGLTGNVAAGKSAVAALWKDAGVPVASADEFARRAVEPGSAALARIAGMFGADLVGADGALDRAALRRIVFADPGARRRLEAVVHPVVRTLRDEWTEMQEAEGAALVVWEVPLLYETGLDAEVDVVVFVDAPADLRRRRLMESRGLAREEAQAVMDAQAPAADKRRRADFVVDNGGSREALAARAAEALEGLRAAGRERPGTARASGRGPRAARGESR